MTVYFGTGLNDPLSDGDEAYTLVADDGEDTDGDDTLVGDDGDETLDGGDGDDTLLVDADIAQNI